MKWNYKGTSDNRLNKDVVEYIYIYMCVCVCVCSFVKYILHKLAHFIDISLRLPQGIAVIFTFHNLFDSQQGPGIHIYQPLHSGRI